jgi:RNA methyltransferase, TrmH family
MTITSPHNPKLKEIRKLAARRERARTGLFVAEGEDLVRAATAAGWRPVHLLSAAGSGMDGEEVEPALLAGASALGSGTRTIGVYEQRFGEPAGPRCVALWGLRDPGNVGTVLRAALSFGAGSVAIGPGCADPYGPKAVRASMGAVFAVPIARVGAIEELPGETVALEMRAGEPLRGPSDATIVVGSERTGLDPGVIAACSRVAHIPIAGDSLNAAMAATVALYELFGGAEGGRSAQRRAGS